MSITAKELAQELGVSSATISFIINNKPGVSDKKREHIINYIKDNGYEYLLQPKSDENATSTFTNIGFVLFQRTGSLLEQDSFLPCIIDEMEIVARKNNCTLNYIVIQANQLQEGFMRINQLQCEGIVIFATEMHESDIDEFEKLGIPFVLLDNYSNSKRINAVTIGNQQGTYLAVQHLVEMGHKKIGYIKSGEDIDPFKERYQCALNAAKKLGTENMDHYTYEVGYPSMNAYKGTLDLLEQGIDLPTAFIGDNDLTIVGAMKAFRERGYGIPKDISFVGFDDRPICTMIEIPLSTIGTPRDAFGAEAIVLLIRQLNGDLFGPIKTEVLTRLIKRETVAKLGSAENFVYSPKAR